MEGRESDSDAGRQAVDQRLWSSQCGFENSKEGVLGPEDTQGSQAERAAGLTQVWVTQIQDAGHRAQVRFGDARDRLEWAFLLQDKLEPDRAGWTPVGLSPGPGVREAGGVTEAAANRQ